MAETITQLKSIIQFRRGSSTEWSTLNPILHEGEPGFELDTGRFKIGDGKTPYNTLPYSGGDEAESSVIDRDTHYEFPSIGDSKKIYKANTEKLLYQWNDSLLKYEVLGSLDDTYDLIYGGNANGENA